MLLKSLAVAGFVAIALPGVAAAQSAGSTGAAQFQNGYGSARYTTARPTTGSTRDANGNRLIVNGVIRPNASAYSTASGGVSSSWSGVGGSGGYGGSSAVGNQLNVIVQGNRNTVIVNSTQTNNGDVSAGVEMNGEINLDD